MKNLKHAEEYVERVVADTIALCALAVEDNKLSDLANQLVWFNGFVSCAYGLMVISDVRAAELRKTVLESINQK